MIKFNRHNFLALIFLSHIAMIGLLLFGTGWQILMSFILFVLLCSFSSTAIYHRLLSHRSWSTSKIVEYVGTFLGVFTFTGTPLTRTLSHRYHHKYTETDLDPHSPQVLGAFKAYFPMIVGERKMDLRLIEDLLKDSFHVWIHRNYLLIIFSFWIASYFLVGFFWTLAIFVVPGALCWMNISICNILCHSGKEEVIVNKPWLAFITFGEGFHKNHHNTPDNADFSYKESPLDLGYFWIRALQNKKVSP